MSHREQSMVEEDASLGKAGIGPDWKDAHPLWNAEVLLILQHHQTATAKEETPRTQSAATQKLLQDTLQYVRSLNNYHSQAAVDEAMLLLEKYPILDKWELAMLNNLRIDDYEECLTLVPTLRHKVEAEQIDKDTVEQILADLKRYQTAT